eukprot:gene7588-biopygen7880
MLHFGTIWEVGGSINGGGSSADNRGSLQLVDFGQVTRVGGNVELWLNHITRIDFGAITHISGKLQLYNNYITHIDFGAITHISGRLYLHNNDLKSIDFGAITYIDDDLWLQNNALTTVDFGAITHIGGSSLRVYNNPSLTSIDCRNLGLCLCRSSNTNPTNCPNDCTWSFCA